MPTRERARKRALNQDDDNSGRTDALRSLLSQPRLHVQNLNEIVRSLEREPDLLSAHKGELAAVSAAYFESVRQRKKVLLRNGTYFEWVFADPNLLLQRTLPCDDKIRVSSVLVRPLQTMLGEFCRDPCSSVCHQGPGPSFCDVIHSERSQEQAARAYGRLSCLRLFFLAQEWADLLDVGISMDTKMQIIISKLIELGVSIDRQQQHDRPPWLQGRALHQAAVSAAARQ